MMADEIENVVVEPEVVEETPTVEEEQEPESRESVISKIGSKIKQFVTGEDDTPGDVIPSDFEEAARNAGWSDEDIVDFASEYSDEELQEMITALNGEDTGIEPDVDSDKVVEPKPKEKQDTNSQEDDALQKALARIEALEKAQAKTSEVDEQEAFQGRIQSASQLFDKLGEKEMPILGKTESIPRFPDGRPIPTSPVMKARSEIFNLAEVLYGQGMDFDDAMSISLNAYKGKNLAADVKREFIKDLKKHETKLGGKRTTHESNNVALSGPDVIREVARRAGKEIL